MEEVIAAFAERYEIRLEEVRSAEESIVFNLPRELRDVAMNRIGSLLQTTQPTE